MLAPWCAPGSSHLEDNDSLALPWLEVKEVLTSERSGICKYMEGDKICLSKKIIIFGDH